MKKFIFIFTLVIFTTFSCKKEEVEPYSSPQLTLLEGNYDWAYTEISEYDYMTYTELPDKYGLRIENGVMYLFKNGSLLSEHPFIEKNVDLNQQVYFSYQVDSKSFSPLYFEGDSIVWITLAPFEWKNNYFYKQ